MKSGDTLANRYKLVRELGRGGKGLIFEALDQARHEKIALKLFLPDSKRSAEMIGRFLREVRSIVEIKNNHVVRIHNIGVAESVHYMSMEFVVGSSLSEKMKQDGFFPLNAALDILSQICSGLAAIHQKNIIHRHMSSANILMTAEGIVKIIDFGIARSSVQQDESTNSTSGVTTENKLVGTPEYMSPEQALARPLDHRSDIYSLGIIMFEMITGKLPFTSENAREVLNKQVKEKPPAPTTLNPVIPPQLELIVLKALAKKAEERHQSAAELLEELLAVKASLSVPSGVNKDIDAIHDDDSVIGVLEIDEDFDEFSVNTVPEKEIPKPENAVSAPGKTVLAPAKQVMTQGNTILAPAKQVMAPGKTVLAPVKEGIATERPADDTVEELFQKGMDSFHQREFSQALNFFEQVVKLNPKHPMAYNYLEITGEQISKDATIARILSECNRALKARQFQKAKTLIDEALIVGPENPMVQVTNKKVTALLEKEKRMAAENPVAVAAVEQSFPASAVPTPQATPAPLPSFEIGKQLYNERRFDEALAIFQEMTDRKIAHPLLFDYCEMSKAAKAAREDIEHHFLTARRLIEEGDLSAARQELQITLDFDPDYAEARKLLEKIEKPAPDSGGGGAEDTSTDEIARKTGKDPAYIKALQEAQSALKQQQFDEALVILARAGQVFPDKAAEVNGYIQKIQKEEHRFFIAENLKRGRLLMQEQRFHQATTVLGKILERVPEHPQANDLIKQCRDKLGEEKLRQDSSTKVLLQAKEAAIETKVPPQSRFNMKIIVGLLVIVVVIGAGVTQYPVIVQKLGEYFRARGMIKLNSGNYDDAVTYLQRAYDMVGDAEIRESLAQALFQKGSYGQAQTLFEDLLKEGGNKTQCHYYLGLIADKLKDDKKAKTSLNAAIKSDPRFYSALNALAGIYFREKQFDVAAQHLRRSLTIKPLQPQVQLDLARIYQTSGQAEAALGVYNLMIKDNPSFIDAYTEMGKLNIGLGRYQAAIAILSRHPHYATGDAALYYTLGDVNEKLAKGKQGSEWRNAMIEANNYFLKCYTINPQHENVVQRLASVLRSLGDTDGLIAMFVMYLRDFPNDFIVNIELATIYQRKKMYPSAQTHFENATRIDPGNVDAWNKLGNLYLLRGNKRDARTAFKKSLEIKPGQSSIRNKLKSL